MSKMTFEQELLNQFPKGSQVRTGAFDGPGWTLEIPCTEGHAVDVPIRNRINPHGLRGNLARQGWHFKGKNGTCPECMDKPKKDEQGMAHDDKQAATDRARRAKREAMQWLEEAFDVEKGRFKEGVSDKSIAEETSLSEKAVAGLREEFFGPMKEPSEFAEFRKRMDELEREATEFQNEAAEAVTAMLGKIEALRIEITRVIERNDW